MFPSRSSVYMCKFVNDSKVLIQLMSEKQNLCVVIASSIVNSCLKQIILGGGGVFGKRFYQNTERLHLNNKL